MMGFVRIVHLSKEKKRGVKQIVQLCNKVINVYQKEKIKNENPRNCRNSTSSQWKKMKGVEQIIQVSGKMMDAEWIVHLPEKKRA